VRALVQVWEPGEGLVRRPVGQAAAAARVVGAREVEDRGAGDEGLDFWAAPGSVGWEAG
jgi:hypothetical protein